MSAIPASTKTKTTQSPSPATKDNERPLVEDIRLLGYILGDVIREQEGQESYELVERVRQLSVAFRRDVDVNTNKALKKLLGSLSGEATVRVIRAFTYFSHLANLAEDRHHLRRYAIQERAGQTQEGSLSVTLSRLRSAGIAPKSIVQTLAHSHVSPVLTAHPTEVQRKSILDAERGIAQLLAQRDDIKTRGGAVSAARSRPDALTQRELAINEIQLRARVLQLWQTRLLRFTKLSVSDEIENALSYYELTFLTEIPKLYAALEAELGQAHVHSFLRMGQWIGGDRDGNPNVNADTLHYALRRQSEVALRHHLTELHYLGSELSMSAMLIDASPGRTLTRHQRAPPGRALSPRPDRHVRPLGCDLEKPDRRQRCTPRRGTSKRLHLGRGAIDRSACHCRFVTSSPRQRLSGTTPHTADACCGCVWFSPRHR
jgi:phosphoenolpyruvate carboxylase